MDLNKLLAVFLTENNFTIDYVRHGCRVFLDNGEIVTIKANKNKIYLVEHVISDNSITIQGYDQYNTKASLIGDAHDPDVLGKIQQVLARRNGMVSIHSTDEYKV